MDSVSIERMMSEEKKILLVPALVDRIRQHEAGFRVAQTRITACMELKKSIPSQADVLNDVINTWMGVRAHHQKVADSSRDLLTKIRQREPSEH